MAFSQENDGGDDCGGDADIAAGFQGGEIALAVAGPSVVRPEYCKRQRKHASGKKTADSKKHRPQPTCALLDAPGDSEEKEQYSNRQRREGHGAHDEFAQNVEP